MIKGGRRLRRFRCGIRRELSSFYFRMPYVRSRHSYIIICGQKVGSIMGFIYAICVAVIVFLAFRASIVLGIIASLCVIAYAIYQYIPTFWAVRAQKAFADGNFQEAKRLYKKSVDTKHAKIQIRINYAYALMRTGDFDEAERILTPIVRMKNTMWWCWRIPAKSM